MRPFVRSQKLAAAVTAAVILATGTSATATAAGPSPTSPNSPTTQLSIQQVQAIGESLAASLESTEKYNWGVQGELPAQFMKLTPTAVNDWASLSQELRDGAEESDGLVSIENVAVDIVDVKTEVNPDGRTIAIYDVHFLRDVTELPEGDDWEEVIPYHVELNSRGEITGLVARDLEWHLANDIPEHDVDPEDPLNEGSATGIAASPEISAGTAPIEPITAPPQGGSDAGAATPAWHHLIAAVPSAPQHQLQGQVRELRIGVVGQAK